MLNEKKTILAGTYTDSGSEGIYSFEFADGALEAPQLFCRISSPKYISVSDGLTASIGTFAGGAGAAVIDADGNCISERAYEARTSCFITWQDGMVYTANYHEGTVSSLTFENGQLELKKTLPVKEHAGCHQLLFHGDTVLVPSLFLDRILLLDRELAYKGAIVFPDGTGPRHGVFSHDGMKLYLLGELSNELYVLNTENWKMEAVLPVLSDGRTHLRGSAAIRLNEDGSRLYVSTRGQDLISVIDTASLKVLQEYYSGGRHPRDFILLDGYLICANRYSDTVVCFHLKEDGTVGEETARINIPQAVSLAVK